MSFSNTDGKELIYLFLWSCTEEVVEEKMFLAWISASKCGGLQVFIDVDFEK